MVLNWAPVHHTWSASASMLLPNWAPGHHTWSASASMLLPKAIVIRKYRKATLAVRLAQSFAGLLFAGMGLISLTGTMPASWVADKLGRKWTIVPSCVGLSAALALMGATGAFYSLVYLQLPTFPFCAVLVSDSSVHGRCCGHC